MTDRALKKGWYPGLIRSVCDKKNEPALLPIIFQGLSLVPSGKHADKEWFPAHAAPDRCFKPAEVPTCWHGGPTDHERGLPEAEKDEPAPEAEHLDKFRMGDPVLMDNDIRGTISRVCGRAERYDVVLANQYVHKAVHENNLRPAPEPERAEPKFQVGQWYESHGNIFVCIDRTYSTQLEEWNYKGLLRGNPKEVLFSAERTMRPHAPVLAAEQEALRPGDVVKNIGIPVAADGVPVGHAKDQFGNEKFDGKRTIDELTLKVDGQSFAMFVSPSVQAVWLWNVELVKKADA